MISRAPPLFPQALEAMTRWMAGFPDNRFCSWGDYDRNQFDQDCRFYRLRCPFCSSHLNLKPAFSRAVRTRRRFGIAEALRRLSLDFEGSHHRGLRDARNIARLVRRVCMGT